MKTINYKEINCKNCGAPVTTEICPYCNSPTGLDTASANMEYPVLECKSAALGFWTTVFPLIFAASFGSIGFVFIVIGFVPDFGSAFFMALGLPIFAIGAVSLGMVIRKLVINSKVKANGKPIKAVVYGYMDDNVLLNGAPAQIVKLLIETPHGKRFILFKTGGTTHPYGINSTINLRVYEDLFLIEKTKETVFDD